MRDILAVRQRVLDCIMDEARRNAVERDTAFLERSVPYTAPEAMQERWVEFCDALSACDCGGLILGAEREKIRAVLRGESRFYICECDFPNRIYPTASQHAYGCPIDKGHDRGRVASPMTKHDQFVLLVQTGAIVNDLQLKRGLAMSVVESAIRMPAWAIPDEDETSVCRAAAQWVGYQYDLGPRPDWAPPIREGGDDA